MTDVAATLAARGNRYGAFTGHAQVTQQLKAVIVHSLHERNKMLDYDMLEALDMICHKIGRIVNGDPAYADSWHDIAGYAKLVDDRLVAAQALDSISDDPIYRAPPTPDGCREEKT
jgi:hypothetical protein